MTSNELSFVRLPPDSTGKKSAAAGLLIIRYEGEASPNLFEANTTVTGGTSSATAEIRGKHTEGFTAGEGELFVDLATLNGTFIVGEALKIGLTTYATVSATAELDQLYYQKSVIVDRDSPSNFMKIGAAGDAFVRFDEGSPALSSFGGLVVEPPESSRQYVYSYDERPNEFYDVTAGSGTLSYVSAERSILLDTNGTASGDLVTRQSHLYHPYQPGTMSKIMQTVVLGDTGKANVRRRWGYFDEENGLFWELDGTTLYVVVRSNTTGSVVDTRVAQSDWNRDKLDGTINFNLDVTKTNLYWIDFQWLGVGICRFGVYEEDGRKTTCHVFENPNNVDRVYMRQGTLPIRYECENTNSAVSSSELKAICCLVQIVGNIKRQFNSYAANCPNPTIVTDGDGEVPVMALKPKLTVNGLTNHALTVPKEFHIISDDKSSGIFEVKLRNLAFTTGGTFTGVAATSHTEINHGPTGFLSAATSGVSQYAAPIKGNTDYDHEFENFTNYAQYSILTTVLSDQTTRPELVLTVKALTAGASGNFWGTMNFDEMVY